MEQKTNLNFGQVIEALRSGKRVSREGWNGKGLFVFQQVESTILPSVVANMQSLPQHVKDEFYTRFTAMEADNSTENKCIRYRNQLAIVYPDNTIYGWTPSPSDALANDWCILD